MRPIVRSHAPRPLSPLFRFLVKTSPLLAVLTGALFVTGCRTPKSPQKDLVVTSFAPDANHSEEDTPPLRFQFDQPVVSEEEVGKPLASPPVSIEPSIEITAHWEDRQTLVIVPQKPLSPSERYQVILTGTLGKRVGKSSFSFVHRPLEVEGLEGIDEDRLSSNPELVIRFNQPVKAADAASACSLKRPDSQETISLTTPDPKKIDSRITLSPARTLAQSQEYTLICEKLSGAQGSAMMEEPYRITLTTYPPLEILSFSPEKEKELAPDPADLSIEFSNPVTLEDVQKYVTIEPAAPGFDYGWLDYNGLHYSVEVNLEPQTTYTVRIDGNMADVYDQKLGTPRTFTFKTGDARPSLQMQRGIYAVESSSEGYPVWTRNISSFEMECARIPKDAIVKLLTSDMNYDPWYDAESDIIHWDEFGVVAQKHTINTKTPKNEWALSQLSLKDFCGGTSNLGLFLAEMSSDDLTPDERYPWRYRPQQRVLANVTDLGVLLKAGASSGLLWVTRLSDGKPVPGARVSVYSPQGKLVHKGTTDASGLVKLPGATKLLAKQKTEDEEYEYYGYRSHRLIAIVESGDDMAVIDGNWANGIQIWNFGVPEERQGGETRIRGFIQSDRGIYRPGETVYFKGIVREIALGKSPRVPAKATVAVRVEDGRGAEVYKADLPLSPFGSFHFEFPLDEEASLGDYYVNAKVKGQEFRERFLVEEFRKVTYELSLKADQEILHVGDAIDFTLRANYLFGAPVKDATVRWSVQRRNHYLRFPSFPGYSFEDYATLWNEDSWWYGSYSDRGTSFFSDGEGETDEDGIFQFSVRDPEKRFSGPQDYLAHVTVTDAADETISTQVVVTAHRSEYYLGLHAQEFVQAVDMPFAVNTIAVSPSGKQVPAKATLSYIRQRYDCSGRQYYFDPCKREKETIWSREINIPATGVSTEKILPKDPGEFIIQVESKDARGNHIIASTYVWVLGKGEAFWSGDESARMSLIASKSSYKPGETARIVPRTSLSGGTALVTLERDGILDARVITLASSAEGVEIALDKSHAPNVFASVALVQGRSGKGDKHRPRFQMGVIDLQVPTEDNQLTVEIETEEDTYEPGQEVSGVIRVTHNGKPVDAEVSLSVADEGVLQLIAYQTPDPMKTFYKSFGLGVDSSTNWNRIAQLNDPRKSLPEEGGDSGGGELSIRSRFVSSAYWAPDLRTDARGEIPFRFTAPDNLTAFRLMAVAADKSVRFGSSDARIRVRKSLQASPNLPRFLNKGDKALVGVMVQNNTAHTGVAVVRASAKGARLLEKEVKEVKVEAGGSARVRFESIAEDVREASFTFHVEMDGHRDAVQVAIPVQRLTSTERATLSQGAVKGSVSIPLTWKSGLLEEDSFVEISVDRTGLGELQQSLRYLVKYPYGCLEQTLSRFIPLTKVQDLAASLGFEELEGEKLTRFIKAGVAKVLKHQKYNGHFSLWPDGHPYPHLTVYAMFGLTEAERAGIKVDALAMRRGAEAIRAWVNDPKRVLGPGGESATMAMAAYVLAYMGKADTGLNARLFEVRQGLAVYGQAFLLSALKLAGGPKDQITTLKDELLAQIQVDGDTAFVKEKDESTYRWYMNSNVRSSAITLSALLAVDPKNKAIEALAEGLKKEMKPGGYWRNTQDNLYALIALSDYARQKSSGSTQVKLSLDGKTLASEELKGGKILTLRRSLRELGQGTLSLEANGEARHSVRMVLVSEEEAKDPVDQGFSITREYLDPETNEELTSFKAGQLVKVRLIVKTDEDRSWVALVDPLPAGFEAVNTRLATSQVLNSKNTSGYAYLYLWTHTELRDDRMMAFADYLPKGTRTLEYLARASTAGEFTVGPPLIEAMYEPEVYGRGIARKVEVAQRAGDGK